MHRFVVLRHEFPPDDARASHWDFMLETDGVLRTWSVAQEPTTALRQIATALADHRIAYLDYEGPVSGNRGSVRRWDAGSYQTEGATAERIEVRLAGERLRGRVTLTRQSPDDQRWEFLFAGD
jgi:DNA ligase D-like protein (predicted 3'-phosphoesterase)